MPAKASLRILKTSSVGEWARIVSRIVMRVSRQKLLLSVVVGERALLIAEASCNANAQLPPRFAEFPFPDQLTMDQPEALGLRFADFLARNSFSATAVVLGISARNLVTRQLHLPPADSRTTAQLLHLQTATHFSEDLGPMVFDFTGDISPDHPSDINLFALQKSCLDRLLAFADSARLRPIAVNAAITALSRATAQREPHAICLSLHPDGADLVFKDAAGLQQLKHIASAALPRLISELRRTAISHASADRQKLVLWAHRTLDANETSAIAQAAASPVIPGDIHWLDPSAPESLTSSAAAPLALLDASRHGRLCPDFLAPKITAPRARAVSAKFTALAAALAAILLVALAAFANIARLQHNIAAARAQLDALAPELQTARPFASQMQFAKTFQPAQAINLNCLKDLTLAIPQDSQTYLTSFTFEAGRKGTCAGHSASEQDVLDVLDKLSSTGRFTGLSRRLSTQHKGNTADILFDVSFTYAPPNAASGMKPAS